MLREVKTSQLRSKITGIRVTTSATPSIVAGVGAGNISSLTRTGGLTQQIFLRETSQQIPVWIGSQTSGLGGWASDAGTAAPSEIDNKIRDNGGSTVDGTCNILAFSTDSSTIDKLPPSRVLAATERQRIIWGKVSSAGAVSIGGSDLTVTKTATGVYSVTYKRAFARAALPFATPIGALFLGVRVTNQSATGCTLTFSTTTPTNTDSAFYFCALGIDSLEETPRARSPLMNSQRKPRIEACRFTVSGGAPTIVVGTKNFSITDNGTGDFTLTLATPFKREFAVFATGTTAGATALQTVAKAATSSSATTIQTYSAANALTDPSGSAPVNVIVIGSDDASEY